MSEFSNEETKNTELARNLRNQFFHSPIMLPTLSRMKICGAGKEETQQILSYAADGDISLEISFIINNPRFFDSAIPVIRICKKLFVTLLLIVQKCEVRKKRRKEEGKKE